MNITIYDDSLGKSSILNEIEDRTLGVNESLEEISLTTLDDFVKENNITKIDFIKADIEGAERLMLSGATNVLKTLKPKLSICTYHLPDDPQVLEDIIITANPDYKVIHSCDKLFAYV